MRNNIRPLPTHVALAASALQNAVQQEMISPQEAQQKLAHMFLGLQEYQTQPHRAYVAAHTTIWQSLPSSLYLYSPYGHARGCIFLIPSLINGHEIFDVCPQRSLVSFLCAQGYAVAVLNWGDLTAAPEEVSFDTLLQRILLPSLSLLQSTMNVPIFALGYCMGGTILAGAWAHMPVKPAGLIFLATPWDFHTGEQKLSELVRFFSFAARDLLLRKKVLPGDFTQTLFAALDPMMGVRKFAKFYTMDKASEEAQIFVAVEDWLNAGYDVPAPIARTVIEDWYLNNAPAQGQWTLCGDIVRPENISTPALSIASIQDRLVEFPSALALQNAIPGCSMLQTDCGHIGMIAGTQAKAKVWEPMAQWINDRIAAS